MSVSSTASVLILGGGLAGLTAALELADHGMRVTVLEQGSSPGGRARSWLDPRGQRVGNVDHLVSGWQLSTRALLQRLSRLDRLQDHPGSAVFSRGRRLSRATRLPLPGPLSALGQRFPIYDEFGMQERTSALFVAMLLASARDDRLELLDEISLRAWGVGFNASMRPFLRHMLDPYSLLALTTTGHSISARTAAAIMRCRVNQPTPFASSFRSCIQTDLVDPLVETLQRKGVVIHTNTRVTRLLAGRTRVDAVEAGGQRFEGTHIISALPPERLQAVLSTELLRYHYFRDISKLRTHPLASVQLFFRVKVTDVLEPVLYSDSELGLYCRDVTPRSPERSPYATVLSCVLTRYEAFSGLSELELVDLVLRELQVMFPTLRTDWLVGFSLQRNDDVPCFLHTTGSWRLRPRVRSPLPNLLLAGDWIRHPIDLACLEGAISSGKLAAQAVLQDYGIETEEPLEAEDRRMVRLLGWSAELAEWPRRIVRKALARTDRRKHTRLEGAFEGYLEDLESHVGWSPVLVLNMSYRGVFFVSEASPRVGARVRLRVRTHRGDQIDLRGRVERVEETRAPQGGSIGVGCKVSPVDERSEALWEMFTHPD